jgi:hypothetical protein
MNAVGWKSAIYALAQVGDHGAPAMLATGSGVVAGAARRFALRAAPQAADGTVNALRTARASYANAIADGMNGAKDATLARSFARVADDLRTAAARPSIQGVSGPMERARQSALDVSDALRRGLGPASNGGAMPEATHVSVWQLRHQLDEALGGLGTAQVMGRL